MFCGYLSLKSGLQICCKRLYCSTGDFRCIMCVTSVLHINFECCTHPWLPGYLKLTTNMLVNKLSVKNKRHLQKCGLQQVLYCGPTVLE